MITGFKVDPCPFCKRNQAHLHLMQLRSMSQSYVRCICGACGPDGSDAESAVKRWNERKGEQRDNGKEA